MSDHQPLAVAAFQKGALRGADPNEVLDGEVVVVVAPKGGYSYVQWTSRRMLTDGEAADIVRRGEELGKVSLTSVPLGHIYQ